MFLLVCVGHVFFLSYELYREHQWERNLTEHHRNTIAPSSCYTPFNKIIATVTKQLASQIIEEPCGVVRTNGAVDVRTNGAEGVRSNGEAVSGLMGRCPDQWCGVRTNRAASELMGRRVSELRGDVRTDGVVSEQIIPLLTQSLNR